VALSSAHYESGNEEEFLPAVFSRGLQARQHANDAKELCARNSCDASVIGGDLNAPFRAADPVGLELRYAGFADAHRGLGFDQRRTLEGTGKEAGTFQDTFGFGIIDYIYQRGGGMEGAGVCHDPDWCHGWSDHTSVWALTDVGGKGAVGYVHLCERVRLRNAWPRHVRLRTLSACAAEHMCERSNPIVSRPRRIKPVLPRLCAAEHMCDAAEHMCDIAGIRGGSGGLPKEPALL
jgi:hypothetical protein